MSNFDDFLGLPKSNKRKDKIGERQTDITATEEYDIKDLELEQADQELYDKCMTAYDRMLAMIDSEDIEPRHIPRFLEVANKFLETANNINKSKRDHKKHKDKLKPPVKLLQDVKGKIVMDRNDLLKDPKFLEAMDNKDAE